METEDEIGNSEGIEREQMKIQNIRTNSAKTESKRYKIESDGAGEI